MSSDAIRDKLNRTDKILQEVNSAYDDIVSLGAAYSKLAEERKQQDAELREKINSYRKKYDAFYKLAAKCLYDLIIKQKYNRIKNEYSIQGVDNYSAIRELGNQYQWRTKLQLPQNDGTSISVYNFNGGDVIVIGKTDKVFYNNNNEVEKKEGVESSGGIDSINLTNFDDFIRMHENRSEDREEQKFELISTAYIEEFNVGVIYPTQQFTVIPPNEKNQQTDEKGQQRGLVTIYPNLSNPDVYYVKKNIDSEKGTTGDLNFANYYIFTLGEPDEFGRRVKGFSVKEIPVDLIRWKFNEYMNNVMKAISLDGAIMNIFLKIKDRTQEKVGEGHDNDKYAWFKHIAVPKSVEIDSSSQMKVVEVRDGSSVVQPYYQTNEEFRQRVDSIIEKLVKFHQQANIDYYNLHNRRLNGYGYGSEIRVFLNEMGIVQSPAENYISSQETKDSIYRRVQNLSYLLEKSQIGMGKFFFSKPAFNEIIKYIHEQRGKEYENFCKKLSDETIETINKLSKEVNNNPDIINAVRKVLDVQLYECVRKRFNMDSVFDKNHDFLYTLLYGSSYSSYHVLRYLDLENTGLTEEGKKLFNEIQGEIGKYIDVDKTYERLKNYLQRAEVYLDEMIKTAEREIGEDEKELALQALGSFSQILFSAVEDAGDYNKLSRDIDRAEKKERGEIPLSYVDSGHGAVSYDKEMQRIMEGLEREYPMEIPGLREEETKLSKDQSRNRMKGKKRNNSKSSQVDMDE